MASDILPLEIPPGLFISRHERNADLRHCAVSLPWLQQFCTALVPQDYTTQQVVDRIILPLTSQHQCACVELIDQQHVDQAHVFISHMWAGSFHQLVQNAVSRSKDFRERNRDLPDQIFVWLDIFAINQQGPDGELEWFKPAIQSARETWVVLDPEMHMLGRLWCMYEVWLTVERFQDPSMLNERHNGVKFLGYNVQDQYSALISAWYNLDVGTAETFKADDKIKILADIDRHGPLELFNYKVGSELLNCAGTLHEKADGITHMHPLFAGDLNPAAMNACKARGRELFDAANRAYLVWKEKRPQAGNAPASLP